MANLLQLGAKDSDPLKHHMKVGDTASSLRRQLIDPDTGLGLNLTGASVKFVMNEADRVTPKTSAPMVIEDAAAGWVRYDFQTADVATAGIFPAEIVVTPAGGGEVTYPPGEFDPNKSYLEIRITAELNDTTPTPTGATLDLYVDFDNGDDSYSGLIGYPVKTLPVVEAKIPAETAHPVIINIAGSATPYDQMTVAARLLSRGNIYFVGTDFTELLGTTAALAGSTANKIVGSGFTLDQYYGKTIEILTGAAADDRRTIRNNSTTEIYPCVPFSAAISPGDTFRIVEPAATIKLAGYQIADIGNGPPLVTGCGSQLENRLSLNARSRSVWFVNLKFTATDVNDYIIFQSSSVVLMGCEADFTTSIIAADSSVRVGEEAFFSAGSFAEGVPSAVEDLGAAAYSSWWGWGFSIPKVNSLTVYEGNIYGIFCAGLRIGPGVKMNLRAGRCPNGINDGAAFIPAGRQGNLVVESFTANKTIIESAAGHSAIILSETTAAFAATTAGGGGIEITAAENGMLIQYNARVFIGEGVTTGTINWTGAVADRGGQIRYPASPAPALTGTLGDFSEDGGVTKRFYATLPSGTSFVNSADLSKVYRR